MLLEFAGRVKVGRKPELLQRALSLIDKGCPTSIVVKINDLNRRRSRNSSAASSSTYDSSKSSSSSSVTSFINMKKSPVQMETVGTSISSFMPFGFPALDESGASSNSVSIFPVHPDVKLKALPFYDLVAELVKPSSLAPKGMLRVQSSTFTFHLTPQQTEDIISSRELIDDCVVEYGLQVLLRFCFTETTSDQGDNFPPNVSVHVNDKLAALPNPIPTNKPGVEPKRPGRPVNITHICTLSPTTANVIYVTWSADPIRNFCISVLLARHLNSDILLLRLKQNGMRHPDHTRALIKEKLASNSDNEIATTSLRVSLKCPVGKMRMTVPCRSTQCNHLQCFDARTFIQMNEKKPTWICPICDRPAEYVTLIIDGLFSEILVKASDSIDIQFTADGNWCPIRPKEEEVRVEDERLVIHTISDSPAKTDAIEMIDLTESDDENISSNSCSAFEYNEEHHLVPRVSLEGPIVDASTSGAEHSCPPSLMIQTSSHLTTPDPLFPVHDTPPSLLPFGDIWDYHSLSSVNAQEPFETLDSLFQTSSGFLPSTSNDPLLGGSNFLPLNIDNIDCVSGSMSQNAPTSELAGVSQPNASSPDVISLD